jgi:glutamine cyclotransferase
MIRKQMPFIASVLRRILLCLTLFVVLSTGLSTNAAPVDSYKVVAKYPHSTDSYTEGFFYLDGLFYDWMGCFMKGRAELDTRP